MEEWKGGEYSSKKEIHASKQEGRTHLKGAGNHSPVNQVPVISISLPADNGYQTSTWKADYEP